MPPPPKTKVILEFFSSRSADSLRIPKDRLRIIFALELKQSGVEVRAVIQAMGIWRREGRVEVVEVSGELAVRLSVGNGAREVVDESENVGVEGERRAGVVLEDPETVAVCIGVWEAGLDGDLGVGSAVEVDDGKPCL